MTTLHSFFEVVRAARSVTGSPRAVDASTHHKPKPLTKKKKKHRQPQSHAAACTIPPKQKKSPKKATRRDAVRASAKPNRRRPQAHQAAACTPTQTKTKAPSATTAAATSTPAAQAPTTQAPVAQASVTPTPVAASPAPPQAQPPASSQPVSGGSFAIPANPVYAPLAATGGDTGWLNVMSFGAHGDGTADDTAALNAACDHARAINVDGGVAVVYLPAGTYNVSGTINVFDVFLRGDGISATVIRATRDWATGGPNTSWVLDQQPSGDGPGKPASSAGTVGPAPTAGTWIEDLSVLGPGQISAGRIPCSLSGIRVGTAAGFRRLAIHGFFAGAFLFSSEEKLLGPGRLGGNYYGVYYGGPRPSTGNQLFADMEIDGCAWAAMGLAGDASLQNTAFRSVSLGSSPFGIYQEEANPGGVTLVSCVLQAVHFDACGNGNIFVNGPAGGGGDIRGCVFQATQSTNALMAANAVSTTTTDARGRAIGRSLAPIDLNSGAWTGNEVQATDPAYIGAGHSSYSAMIACGSFSAGRYGAARTAIAQAALDGKLFTTGSATGDAIIVAGGATCRLLPAGSGGIGTGDLVEGGSGARFGVQRSTGSRRAYGVALHPAPGANTVAVACSGIVTVNSGTNTINPDDPIKADPSQVGCVMTAGLTDPSVIGVAQQASSGGTVQAVLQSL